MRDFLEPIFSKYKVDIYLCGHEHHLEHIKPADCTHYILSGAASEARPVAIYPAIGKFAAGIQGFATFSVSQSKILVQFINYKDKIIYETTIIK